MQPKYISKKQHEQDMIEFEATHAGSDLDIKMNGILVAFFNGSGELFLCDFYKGDRSMESLQARGLQFVTNPSDDDTFVVKVITK